ncbi:hypothetical protein Hypma_013383 [Hypsizygus marmoreus]|uniref:Lysine-specific metallo-endopeptidase domain-containing protein n=1 Tax=Hypsizygus marmoreus TaxID=39966 RepID=A0A369JBS9_HYPMA|nr:hypothetical protein Hypma_013383 [Hypsizygus marmoreus]
MFSFALVTLALSAFASAFPASVSIVDGLSRRSIVDCANPTQNAVITQAFSDAHQLATLASAYITLYGASNPLFIAYWKTNSAASIKGYYDAILNETGTNKLYCHARSPDSCPGNNAYTVQPSGNIYFCPPFYNLANQSDLCNSGSLPATRSGTMLHELGHAVNHRADISGSCSGSQSLSAADAIENTTSFSCFARQVYRNTQC